MLVTKLLETCAASLRTEGCKTDFFSVQKKTSDTPIIISSYPEQWVNHYIEKEYWKEDPAVIKPQKNSIGTFWGEGSESPASQIVSEARDFSIRSGFSFEIPNLFGNAYTITISSEDELSSFKKNITPLDIAQIARYGALLNNIIENHSEKLVEKCLEHIQYESDIYKTLKQSQNDTLTALDTLRSEISFSAPASILDKTTFLVDYTHQKITSLE